MKYFTLILWGRFHSLKPSSYLILSLFWRQNLSSGLMWSEDESESEDEDEFLKVELLVQRLWTFLRFWYLLNYIPEKFQFTFFFFLILFLFHFTILYWFLPNIEMNPPQVYMCSPSWTLLPPLSPYHPSGSSQCTSPKHPVSCIEPGLATRFIYDIIRVSMPFSQIIPPSPSPTESKTLF